MTPSSGASIWPSTTGTRTKAVSYTHLDVYKRQSLVCVLALAYALLGRWFRKAQQVRDAARSDWINGISHDIRTPLSMVMGYAAQMESAADLPPQRQKQAGIIRTQSQAIRDLVNDLNLTMRLDWAMQPLRKERLQPDVYKRQVSTTENKKLPSPTRGLKRLIAYPPLAAVQKPYR